MSREILLVLSTCPAESADQLAHALVEEAGAACVNILPGVKSVFRWKGQVQEAHESLLQIKCSVRRASKVESILKDRHPYEVPEFIVLRIDEASEPYLNWVVQAGVEADAHR